MTSASATPARSSPVDSAPWRNPETVFIGSGVAFEASLWAFYLGAIIWWTLDLGLGPLKLVLLGTVLEGTVLVAEVPTGVVADRYSRKWSVVVSFTVMGIAMILAVVSTNYLMMLFAQALFGVGWTFRSGAEVAWLSDEMAAKSGGPEPDLSSLLLRRHRLGLVAGLLTLPLAVLIGRWSLRALVSAGGMLLLAVAGFLAVAMSDHHRQGADEDERHALLILREGFATARRVRSLRLLMLVMLLLGLGAEALDRLGVKQFIDESAVGGDPLVYTAVLFAGLAVLAGFVVWAAERRLAGGSDLASLAMGLAGVAAVGAWVAATAPAAGIALGMLLQDPCREALDPVSASWANRHAPDGSRATVLSFVSQAHGLGELGGGLLLASLAELVGIRPVIFIAGILWAAAALTARSARSEVSAAPTPAD